MLSFQKVSLALSLLLTASAVVASDTKPFNPPDEVMPARLAPEPTVTARGFREPPNVMKRGRADVQAVKREPGVSVLAVF
jgi:hypothetical protein